MAGFAATITPVRLNEVQRAAVPRQVSLTGHNPLPGGWHRPKRHFGLIGFCTGFMLIATTTFASDIRSGQPDADAPMPASQSVEELLHQIEQQITIGHTMAPPDDNALVTWHRLLEVASPTLPATEAALTDFVANAQRRSGNEQAAGRMMVADDLLVFAEQATEFLHHRNSIPTAFSTAETSPPSAAVVADAPSATAPNKMATLEPRPPEISNDPIQPAAAAEVHRPEVDQVQTQAPSAEIRQTEAGHVKAQTPPATTSNSVALALNKQSIVRGPELPNTAAVSAALTLLRSAGTKQITQQEQVAAAAIARRGDAMLEIKDIPAARGFYEYAANAGSARAALSLARTYDSAFLNQWGVIGPRPNAAMAADWYRKATALGDRSAESRLQTLEAEAAR